MFSLYIGIGIFILIIAAFVFVKRAGKKEAKAEANEDLIKVVKDVKKIHDDIDNASDSSNRDWLHKNRSK